MRGRLWLPSLLLIIGLGTATFGWRMAVSESVSCGSRAIYQGDTCQTTTHYAGDNSTTGTATYDQALTGKHRLGWSTTGVGGLFVAGGGFLLFRRTVGAAYARRRAAKGRAELAQARGWEIRVEHPHLLRTWQRGPFGLSTVPSRWEVLSGAANGHQFVVFDHRMPHGTLTACVVRLHSDAPDLIFLSRARHAEYLSFNVFGPNPMVDVEGPELSWARSVRSAVPEWARALLTPAVLDHVREHRLNFALHDSWLTIKWPSGGDQRRTDVLIEAATRLANLLPTGVRR
ncbi:type III secretion system chaperone family protein [Micromonospora arborensis]|uniref:hypothetical protein n=1 Tax=Micromonospora arborensis TaxID=2116518 RepID=UPI0037208224